MSVFKKPQTVRSMHDKFNHYLHLMVRTACIIMERTGGATQNDLERFRTMAELNPSVDLLHRLGDYAEEIMPRMEKNREKWPRFYRNYGFVVTDLPAELRRDATEVGHDFARYYFQSESPTPRQRKISARATALHRRLSQKHGPHLLAPPPPPPPPQPPRMPWQLENVPASEQTAQERKLVGLYCLNPEDFEPRKSPLHKPLQVACHYGYPPRNWNDYYNASPARRATILSDCIEAALWANTTGRRDLLEQTQADLQRLLRPAPAGKNPAP